MSRKLPSYRILALIDWFTIVALRCCEATTFHLAYDAFIAAEWLALHYVEVKNLTFVGLPVGLIEPNRHDEWDQDMG